MFNLYFNIDLMLDSLEYILPLCNVYCMVIISVHRWTNYSNKIGKGGLFSLRFFFVLFFLLLIKDSLQTGCVKKWNLSVALVYIDSHDPKSAVLRATIFSMNPKDDW